MKKNRVVVIRIILILLTVSTMAGIFILSADNANESSGKSSFFVDRLIGGILTKFDFSEEEIENVLYISTVIVRKTAHFTEYAVLGFLLASVFSSFYLKQKNSFILSFLIGSAYAVSDEIHQRFVPGRSCQIKDMVIDSLGVMCGILFLLLIIYLLRLKQKKKNHRQLLTAEII